MLLQNTLEITQNFGLTLLINTNNSFSYSYEIIYKKPKQKHMICIPSASTEATSKSLSSWSLSNGDTSRRALSFFTGDNNNRREPSGDNFFVDPLSLPCLDFSFAGLTLLSSESCIFSV